MDITELEAAYAELLTAGERGATPSSGTGWDTGTVLAHVIASSRMLAAASAELLAGRIPVVDNRPTQSRPYLEAIGRAAGSHAELLRTVQRSGTELTILAAQLGERQIATSVPTIILDAGRIRVERPVPFSSLLGPGHVREHLEQLRALAGNPPV
jgi:hypothetical protein